MISRRRMLAGVFSTSLLLGSGALADKKGNGKKKVPSGQVKRQTNGKAKAIPPGQIKRYTRGEKLPSDLDWDDITDLDKWKFPAPGKGNRYIRLDDEIYEIAEDTNTVVKSIGIVSDWLK